MARPVLHVSSGETIRDIASLLAKVRAGVEVIVEDDAWPVAVIRPAEPKPRMLSEIIEALEARGSKATLDEEFGKDLEEIIEIRRERLKPRPWD